MPNQPNERIKDKPSGSEQSRAEIKNFDFPDLESAREYLDWKENSPREIRIIVERFLKDLPTTEIKTDLRRVGQLLSAFDRKLRDPDFDFNQAGSLAFNLLNPLTHIKTKTGFIDAFSLLRSQDTSWRLRKSIYDLQIKPALEWAISKDLEDLKKEVSDLSKSEDQNQESQTPSSSSRLPPDEDRSVSSMQTRMEKGEGPPEAIFSVRPFYGGYYERCVFNRFNNTNGEWERPENEFKEAQSAEIDRTDSHILFGLIEGNKDLALPLSYNQNAFDLLSLDIDPKPEGDVQIRQNQDGFTYLRVNQEGIFNYQISFGSRIIESRAISIPENIEIEGDLPEEIKSKIKEPETSNLQPMARARALVKFIRDHLKYSSGDDEANQAWQNYRSDPNQFFVRIWSEAKADCHVANTLTARVLKEAGFNCRFVGGYFVKDKDDQGNAIMHSGNGHAWLWVWDTIGRKYIRLDATPKDDPNIDEEAQEQDLDSENKGDFGESEIMSEDDLHKRIREMERKEKSGQDQFRGVDVENANFAGLAGCTPEQAKEFFKALERVREIKDKNGNPITEILKREWQKIIEERKKSISDYRGPVRMDEGDRLEDPISAKIDILSGEKNPTGFERETQVEKIETDFGGLNLYFMFDLSGSMSELDSSSGRSKVDVQRDMALLFIDSLMQVAFSSRQEGSPENLVPIKIMATLASDSGQLKLPLTDRWGPKEQWAFYSALNQLATGTTPTDRAISYIKLAYEKELKEIKKKGVPDFKKPIHYTIEVTDGAPNNINQVRAMHEKLASEGMAIRGYIVGDEVPENYGANVSPVDSFSSLPQILLKDIIEVFQKLRPRKIKLS